MFFGFFIFFIFRDNYGATPKDRLSEEEEYYEEIVSLLNVKSGFVPQQQSQQHTSGVSGLMSSLVLDFVVASFIFPVLRASCAPTFNFAYHSVEPMFL